MTERIGWSLFGGQPHIKVVYAPRWRTDHHPWLTKGMDPQFGIRYANYEVTESSPKKA